MNQVIPITTGGVMLLVLGALLLGSELMVPSFGILGIGGIVSLILGAVYLVDVEQMPDLRIDVTQLAIVAGVLGALVLAMVFAILRGARGAVTTGIEGLLGQRGRALEDFSKSGKVFVNGSIWSAVTNKGIVHKDTAVRVNAVLEGLTLEVEPLESEISTDT